MPFLFKLPDVGEGINEGEIVSWFVREGDLVKEDEPLLELQNDKLLQEIPSPVTGKISKILVSAGTIATVGDGLVEIEVTDGKQAELTETVLDVTSDAAPINEKPNPMMSVKTISYPNNSIAGRILALPSIRQYAREQEIDLMTIQATGKHGHVTRADVDAEIQRKAGNKANNQRETQVEETQVLKNPLPSTVNAGSQDKSEVINVNIPALSDNVVRERFSITRKAISKAMMTSQHNTAHVAVFDEVDVTKLMAHREKFKGLAQHQGIRLTYLPYFVKALIAAARKFPIMNASVDEQKEDIVYKKYYNIGIAVDTDHGLYVPTIKQADTKGVFSIAKEISVLTEAAKQGTLTGADMRQGTMTITNIGSVGGLWFTPIINYPEVIILGIGRIVSKPIVLEDGTIGIGNMLALSLSFDHRIIDGKTAQLAMNEIKRLLADPELLLMEG